MNIVSIVVLVVSTNLDDLAMGFSIGIQKRIPIRIILTIATLSGLAMALGIGIGGYVTNFIPEGLNDLIGAMVFLTFGIYFIFSHLTGKNDEEKEYINLSHKMGMLLGAALSANSLLLGISAGITEYPLILTSVATFLVSFGFILSGSLFGRLLQPILSKSHFISGILLILLAFAVLLTPLKAL